MTADWTTSQVDVKNGVSPCAVIASKGRLPTAALCANYVQKATAQQFCRQEIQTDARLLSKLVCL